MDFDEELMVKMVWNFQDCESVKGLLMRGINPDVSNEQRTTVLMMSALLPNADICEALLNWGACADFENEIGITALHCANTDRAAELLIRSGARVDAVDEQENTALHYAVMRQAPSVIQILLRHGACYLSPNDEGDSPLALALMTGGRTLAPFIERIQAEKAKRETVALRCRVNGFRQRRLSATI